MVALSSPLERVRVRPSRFSRSSPEELPFNAFSLMTTHQAAELRAGTWSALLIV